jgi:methyltransferase (TIGR00027 family)
VGQDGPLRGAGKTALGMALVRARESRREDRLFDDPHAQAFADAATGAFPDETAAGGERAAAGELGAGGPLARLGEVLAFHAVIRTRFFDDYLLGAAAAGCRQVVLLAAGLDTRALRLPWPAGTRLYEIDLPDVTSFKETVLARSDARPACERTVIPADLRGSWPAGLAAAGHSPAAPTAWLAEGLLLYLTAAEATRLFTGIGDLSAPGSQLSFEHGTAAESTLVTQARAMPGMGQYAALWKGGLGQDAPAWLDRHGWQSRCHDLATLAAAYGRPVSGAGGEGFLTALRTG